MKTKLFSLDNIKEILKKDGFRTSWINPFMKWQRPDLYADEPQVKTGETLYVIEPPVSWITPFDLAMVSIRIDDKGIFFELSFCYVNLLEDQTEVSVINEIYDLHQYWHGWLVSFYSDVAEKFSLTWDIEHDYYTEGTLFGHLQSEESVLNIFIMLKYKEENRLPWRSFNPNDWSSDFPEIDCKLKKYRDHIDLLDRLERLTYL